MNAARLKRNQTSDRYNWLLREIRRLRDARPTAQVAAASWLPPRYFSDWKVADSALPATQSPVSWLGSLEAADPRPSIRGSMDASPEAFETICKYHASGGTTALLLTTATAPIDALVRVVEVARKAARTIRQIAGVHIEGPFISKSKPGAQRAALMHEPAP